MNSSCNGLLGMMRLPARKSSLSLFCLIAAMLLLPQRSRGEAGLLTYSLSAAPVAASTLWNAASLSYHQPRMRKSGSEIDAPLWARAGARELQSRIEASSRMQPSRSLLNLHVFKTVQPGMGDLFEYDTVGREQLAGTRVEDVRWIYLKFQVLGGKK